MNRNTKIGVLNRLIDKGYTTDAAIKNYPLERADELGLTKADEYTALFGIRRAVKERRLISYLAEEDIKESDVKKAHTGKAGAAGPQKEVIAKAESVNTEEKTVTAEVKTHAGTDKERISTVPGNNRILP